METPAPPSMPALLRAARERYATTVHAALAAIGCDDIPKDGTYVIGALARAPTPIGQIVADLRISKQSAGQLIDTLVLRGYLNRETDPDDRRRLIITLTDRGRGAAAATRAAIAELETTLARAAGAQAIATTRATLRALIDLPRHDA